MPEDPHAETRDERPARVAVKVCGVTNVDDALLAARCGADAVGFVFWPRSPRAVDVETARRIGSVLPPFVTRVGVFVDASAEELRATSAAARLDMLQLHGDEAPEIVGELERRVLKALRVGEGFDAACVGPWVERGAAILLDTALPGGPPGGTGLPFEWAEALKVRSLTPHLVLAGGLTAANVGRALAAVRPDGVDVSSGVEAGPGRKDALLLRAFLGAVREAERGGRAPEAEA